MIIKSYKTRTGWGKWSTVLVYKCEKCGNTTNNIKNWHGPNPKGTFICNYCGYAIAI